MNHETRRVRRERAVELVRRGASLADAANETGLSISYIYMLARNEGVPLPMGDQERRERREAAIELLREGIMPEEVERRLGLSAHYVAQLAYTSGISCRRKMIARRSFHILASLLKGTQQQAVADQHGVSRQYVSQIANAAREAGIELP